MRFDLFCSIAPTPVGGVLPPEATILRNFLAQCAAADELGYGTVWVAESHYSNESQKRHRHPVLTHWTGEVGLNADICQLAPQVFSRTRRIEVGSAIMNIICNGGPLPAAERVATALTWHGLDPAERRRLHVGFAAGRFDYINRLTGVGPRAQWEELAWPQVKGAIMAEAAEIFVRLLTGEELSDAEVPETHLRPDQFREPGQWDAVVAAAGAGSTANGLRVPRRWPFELTRIVPTQFRRDLLTLVIGSHDPQLQIHVNRFVPVQVFNLSITRPEVIEQTHERMRAAYHPAGGPWQRWYLPRTTFVFVNGRRGLDPSRQRAEAQDRARDALAAYWRAMHGTVDPAKVADAADNALVGNPDDVAEQIARRFHPDDRLMLWFDFFDHDNDRVVDAMTTMVTEVVPRLRDLGITVDSSHDVGDQQAAELPLAKMVRSE
jgi:alkanesulfonate monooxygenase SsuD/methylene tetrahydromethanopterin reductase-like flavin-dependent oxidoreductase (luciferase family)